MKGLQLALIAGLGFRYFRAGLWGSSGLRYVRFVNRASVIGLALGTAALIMVVAVMNGFDRTLKDRLLAVTPHLTVAYKHRQSDLFINGVASVQSYQSIQGLLLSDNGGQLIEIQGLADSSPQLRVHKDAMVTGRLWTSSDEMPMLMGSALARRFGLALGDPVSIALVNVGQGQIEPKLVTFTLIGTYAVGAETDQVMVVAPLDRIALAAQASPVYRVHLTDPMDVESVAGDMANAGVNTINSWKTRYGSFFQAVWLEKMLMSLMLSMLVLLSLVSLVSGMRIVMLEKLKTTRMLRALGLSRTACQMIFFQQGTLLAISGITLGTFLGLVGATYLPNLMGILESLTGFSIVTGSYFAQLPVDIRVFDTALVSLGALLMSLLVLLRLITSIIKSDLDFNAGQ